MQTLIKIGTRKSLLALAQSNGIKAKLEKQYPGITVELNKIMTKGDKILDVPLAKVGGKGLFVKELEEAMLDGVADIAVHSMKDVPAELPEGLHLGIITKREDPRDAFVSNKYSSLNELPQGAKIGTSSLRRRAQLSILRPDLVIEDLRGNLDTRLRKLDEGQYDAIILAAAGLNRLNLSDRIAALFDPADMLPAVGQGALGIEINSANKRVLEIIRSVNDEITFSAVRAERALLKELEGGCQVPIGALAEVRANGLYLDAMVGSLDGSITYRKKVRGSKLNPEKLGKSLAKDLKKAGAKIILDDIYKTSRVK